MAGPAALHRHRFVDYLALEEASNIKHEFLNGEIYAVAGGTPEHAALAAEIEALSVRLEVNEIYRAARQPGA